MNKNGATQPTEVELQILRVLWDLGKGPVREIHNQLCQTKATNYSTTVKMLSVMLDKGLVKRDESVSPHVYRPALSRDRAGKRVNIGQPGSKQRVLMEQVMAFAFSKFWKSSLKYCTPRSE